MSSQTKIHTTSFFSISLFLLLVSSRRHDLPCSLALHVEFHTVANKVFAKNGRLMNLDEKDHVHISFRKCFCPSILPTLLYFYRA